MAEFRMPSLGADMEAGTLVAWKVKPGDRVARGDIVAVVETDKGLIEVEIWEGGVVDRLLVEPDTRVPVGTVLATIRGADETEGDGARAPEPPPAPEAVPPEAVPAAASPTKREAEPPPEALSPTPGPAPREATPTPTRRRAPAAREGRASPAARKLARERGLDLARIAGTGPHGAVLRCDVEKALAKAAPEAAAPDGTDRKAAMRRAIAAAMSKSKREIPHYYLATTVDFGAAQAWIDAWNLTRPVTERLLPIALVVKAVGVAARDFPEINGTYESGRFEPSASVNVGVAISLRSGGLVTPALHDVDQKPVDVLMREFNALVERARGGRLRSSDLTDGTITLTSLGERGAESVYGVIFPPQVAIVGAGRVVEQPRAVDGSVRIRPVLRLTLAADHRVSDGHRGSLFLQKIDRLLQQPEAS